MNDKPTATLGQEKSRRSLLALVGAGGAAALAALLGRRDGAQAGHDSTDVFHLGQPNTAFGTDRTSRTATRDLDAALVIENVGGTTNYRDGLYASGSGSGNWGLWAVGDAANIGVGVVADGDWGVSGNGTTLGVRGGGVTGVIGVGTTTGVRGEGPTAVHGVGTSVGVQGDGPTAVRGIGTSVGVRGDGPTGVRGFASTATGTAVYGAVPSGSVGVRGHASGAGRVGVSATAVSGALALSASGRTKFSNAGKVVVSAGASSKQVTGKIVPSAALIFATLRTNPGSVDIKWIRRDSDTAFTIFLTGAAPRNLAVDYFITN